MKELLLATKNPGKFKEISSSLKSLNFKLVFLKDLGLDDSDFVEDGETFQENAFKKAKYYFDKTGMLTLAEDSGIVVDALDGELGVKTRRWGAGENASDEEWIKYFLERMSGVPDEKRTAKFVCHACLITEDGEARFFEGETKGVLARELIAPIIHGLPLSSVFIPEGESKAYAGLSAEEKNKISHRGKAISKVGSFLANFKA